MKYRPWGPLHVEEQSVSKCQATAVQRLQKQPMWKYCLPPPEAVQALRRTDSHSRKLPACICSQHETFQVDFRLWLGAESAQRVHWVLQN